VRQIAEQLQKITQAESIQISESSLIWIAEAADGGMRDAQSLLDQVISYGGMTIDDQTVSELLGLSDRQFLFRISQSILERNAGDGLHIVEEAYYAGVEMTSFYQMLQVHFRNLLLIKIADPNRALTDISIQDVKRLQEQVENISRETLLRLLDILMAEEEKVRRSQNPRLNIEQAVVRMAYMPPMIPIDDILDKIEELRKKISAIHPSMQKNSVIAKKEETIHHHHEIVPDADTAPLQREYSAEKNLPSQRDDFRNHSTTNETPAQLWAAFLAYVKDFSYPLWSKIESAQIMGCADGWLQIGFRKDYIFLDELKKQEQATLLNTMCNQCFGDRVIGLHIKEIERAGEITEENNQDIHQEMRREALNQPLLQAVLDVFEGASVERVLPLDREQDPFIQDTTDKNT